MVSYAMEKYLIYNLTCLSKSFLAAEMRRKGGG